MKVAADGSVSITLPYINEIDVAALHQHGLLNHDDASRLIEIAAEVKEIMRPIAFPTIGAEPNGGDSQ